MNRNIYLHTSGAFICVFLNYVCQGARVNVGHERKDTFADRFSI